MKCNISADKFINEHIYKNKVVVFHNKIYEERIENLFVENYKHKPLIISIKELEAIQKCLLIRTDDNVYPKVYINGMYAKQFNDIEKMHLRNDLDIIF
jgi:hypothetical protein